MSLVAVALAGFGVAGGAIALLAYLARWLKSTQKALESRRQALSDSNTHARELEHALEDRDQVIFRLEDQIARLERALDVARGHVDDLVEMCHTEPEAVAAGIRAELSKLAGGFSRLRRAASGRARSVSDGVPVEEIVPDVPSVPSGEDH